MKMKRTICFLMAAVLCISAMTGVASAAVSSGVKYWDSVDETLAAGGTVAGTGEKVTTTDVDWTLEEQPLNTEVSVEPAVLIGNMTEMTVNTAALEARTIHISNEEDLIQLATDCRRREYSINLVVEMDGDITLTKPFQPIPTFSGIFNGNDHAIHNFTCGSNGSHQGLFRYVQEEGIIRSLRVDGTVAPSGSRCEIGGIVGTNYGIIVDCSFEGAVTGMISVGGIAGESYGSLIGCSMTGSVSGKHFTGGIVGYSEGKLLVCDNKSSVNIEIITEAINLEELDISALLGLEFVSADDSDSVSDSGGIAGISTGIIYKCTNSGTVGYSHYGYNVGGIAGRQSGYLGLCDNSGDVYGRNDVGGIVGQMEPYLILEEAERLSDEIGLLSESMTTAMGNLNANAQQVKGDASVAKGDVNVVASDFMDDYGVGTLDDYREGDIVYPGSEKDKEDEPGVDWNAVYQKGTDLGGQGLDYTGGLIDRVGEDTAARMVDGKLTDEDIDKIIGTGIDVGSEEKQNTDSWLDQKKLEKAAEEAQKQAENEKKGEEITLLRDSVYALSDSLGVTLGDLSNDMEGVSGHYINILNMLNNYLSGNAALTILNDISDMDTDENTEGNVTTCNNRGNVDGDVNVGGIAGNMGVELEFDLEGILSADVTDSIEITTNTYFAKCIVRECLNDGLVNGKKDNIGGVVGYSEMGVVISNQNYGDVVTDGSFVGGIVGKSDSIVQNSYALCDLNAKEYVGGITGQGLKILANASIVTIDPSIACSGAIAGYVDMAGDGVNVAKNYFVSDVLGGIDGISRDGVAEMVSYKQLSEMSNLPERFRTLTVTFRANGYVLQEFYVPYGGSLDASQIPAVPEQEGTSGIWPIQSLDKITASQVIDAVYLNDQTAIALNYSREGSPLSIVLLEGRFNRNADVEMTDIADQVSLSNGHRIYEAWRISMDETAGNTDSYTVRYQAPKADKGSRVHVLVEREGSFEDVKYTTDGQYLVFNGSGTDLVFCTYISAGANVTYIVMSAILLVAMILLAILIMRRKNIAPSWRKSRKARQTA